MAGALVSARLRQMLSTEAIVRWASVAFAVAAAIAGLSTHLLATMAALLVAGAGWVLALSTFNVAVQLSAPRWVVARALVALSDGCVRRHGGGKLALGRSREQVTASARHCWRPRSSCCLCALLGRWLPLAQAEELNLDPLRLWNEPTTAVPVEPRTGPVVITIEYVIREEDIVEFLAAMAERRRIRRRDGARNWRLLRDLADPQTLDRALRDADVARLHSSQQPPDAGRRDDSRAPSRTASRPGRAARPPHDRTSELATTLEQPPEALIDPTRLS